MRQCHDEGLFVAFYMKLTNINWKPMFHERPESREWLMRYADGRPAIYLGHPDRYMGCLNNPNWRSHLKEMIAKAVEHEPDSLFYDNCFVPRELAGLHDDEAAAAGWACYCDVCRVSFREYTAKKLGWECELPCSPKWDDPVWQAFINFRDEYFADAMGMVVDYAHELNPDIVVYPNLAVPWMGGGGAKGSATHLVADKVDLILLERRGAPRLESPPAGGMPRAINAVVDWKYGSRVKSTPTWYRQNKPGSHTPDQMKIGLAESSAFNGATHHIMAALFTHEHVEGGHHQALLHLASGIRALLRRCQAAGRRGAPRLDADDQLVLPEPRHARGFRTASEPHRALSGARGVARAIQCSAGRGPGHRARIPRIGAPELGVHERWRRRGRSTVCRERWRADSYCRDLAVRRENSASATTSP